MIKKAKYANYDFDDNLFFMPTKIILFHKKNKSELHLTTFTFGQYRENIGKKEILIPVKKIGKDKFKEVDFGLEDCFLNLECFKIISSKDLSFKQFRDNKDVNFFLKDIKEAIKEGSFGPSFKDFQKHCLDKEIAKNIRIITARGQSPETIYSGLKYLKKIGLIKNLPPLEQIIPVSYKKLKIKEFRSKEISPQFAKINVLMSVLDEIEKKEHITKVSFGFSDDDVITFQTVKSVLTSEILKGRWSSVEVNLFFTGSKENKKEKFVLYQPN